MKLQETAPEKCRCFGGSILLVHFSGKAFTFDSQACPVSKKAGSAGGVPALPAMLSA